VDNGRATVDQLIRERSLERVPANRDHADLSIAQALQHVESVRAIAASDPTGAYAMAYDAVRKAFVAVLENQGLRPDATATQRP
jgi:hypothetical protein